VSGVDLKRFRANATVRKKIREKLKLKKDEVVFLFVGRLNRDKGIPELYEAFLALRGRMSEARLLLVGPEEERISLPAGLAGLESGVRRVGPSSRPEDFMAAADVLVLPSHREGFGSTVIEAGACGIPALASRIYGLTDAVVHGQTGLLVPCGEVGELTRAMERLGKDKNLRLRMGRAACRRARAKFAQEKITGALLQFYRKMIQVR
jgi:glycosyltransferase involved in cell wall biosynthesis